MSSYIECPPAWTDHVVPHFSGWQQPGEYLPSYEDIYSNRSKNIDYSHRRTAKGIACDTDKGNAFNNVYRWLETDAASKEDAGQNLCKDTVFDVIMHIKRTPSNYFNSDSYSDITDPFSAGSRPGSSLLSENELANTHTDVSDVSSDPMYFVSLPNTPNWTVVSADQNRHIASSSPLGSSSTLGSRHSLLACELSLSDEVQIPDGFSYVPMEGRNTPPPPYRPPITDSNGLSSHDYFSNSEDCKMTVNIFHTPVSGRLTPPPPYTDSNTPYSRGKHHTDSTSTTNFHPTETGVPADTSVSRNSPLTADRVLSAAVASCSLSMPATPAENDVHGGQEGCFPVKREEEVEAIRSEVLVPADPKEWNRDHISQWLTWTENNLSIGPVDRTRIPSDGATLCSLSMEDFRQITGNKRAAEILSIYLAHLRQACGCSKPSMESTNTVEKIKNAESHSNFFDSVKQFIGKCFNPDKSSSSSAGGGQIQLWQFLLELLSNPENSSIIAWEGEFGEFRFIHPEEVARRWGERKSKEKKSKRDKTMNYDKLSRSLRYYYDKGTLSKVNGKRYTYRFHFDGLLRACQPTGVSDSNFIQPGFELNDCDYNCLRNFNFKKNC